jgi:hypothetical protein
LRRRRRAGRQRLHLVVRADVQRRTFGRHFLDQVAVPVIRERRRERPADDLRQAILGIVAEVLAGPRRQIAGDGVGVGLAVDAGQPYTARSDLSTRLTTLSVRASSLSEQQSRSELAGLSCPPRKDQHAYYGSERTALTENSSQKGAAQAVEFRSCELALCHRFYCN